MEGVCVYPALLITKATGTLIRGCLKCQAYINKSLGKDL